MRRTRRYRTDSFGVTWLDSTCLGGTTALFRISGRCLGAVKRNKVKRVIRHMFISQKPSSKQFVFHVHKEHTGVVSSWEDYLKRLKHDLENFILYMEQRPSFKSRHCSS